MRKTVFALLLACSTLPGLAVAADTEMTADQVIAKNIESRGGQEAFEAVETVKITGRMTQGGMEFPVTLYFKRPDKARLEFEVQGMTGIQAYDGTTGWFLMPFTGNTEPQEMPAAQLEQFKNSSDFDGDLYGYAEKGHTVELKGVEDVEGTEAYVLEIRKENGDVVTDYLDTEYFLEFKQRIQTDVEGNAVRVDVDLGDYKEVGDPPLLTVHSIDQRPEGAPAGMSVVFESIETNVEVDDALFTMPAPAAPAPAATDGE